MTMKTGTPSVREFPRPESARSCAASPPTALQAAERPNPRPANQYALRDLRGPAPAVRRGKLLRGASGVGAASVTGRSFSASSDARARSARSPDWPTPQSRGRAGHGPPTAGAAAWSTSATDASTIPGTSSPTEPSTGGSGPSQDSAGEVQGPAQTHLPPAHQGNRVAVQLCRQALIPPAKPAQPGKTQRFS